MTNNKITLTKEEISDVGDKILKLHNNILSDVDDAILDYVDEDWKEYGEYESEYDWYSDFGRNEAEDQVINDIIREYENDNKVSFDIDTFVAIGEYIAYDVGINY